MGQPDRDLSQFRRAEELPPPESRERPEDPYSHDWNRVWEPTYVPPKGEHRRSISYVSTPRIPETELQALMESAPFEEPRTSLESGEVIREKLANAIDELDPRLKWIFEAKHYRGMSVRQIGLELNLAKSYVDRLFKEAVARLQESCSDLL